MGALILGLDHIDDFLITRDKSAIEAHGPRIEPVRVVVRVRYDRIAFGVERGEDIERPHEARNVDEDGVSREVHAGTDAAPKAKRELEVEEARIRRLDEPLGGEVLGVGEEDRVLHDSAASQISARFLEGADVTYAKLAKTVEPFGINMPL